MNDRDLDLILALAESRLPADEVAVAAARVAADPDLTAELEAQRTAITAIRSAGSVAMTDAERMRMRAALEGHLNLSRESTAVTTRTSFVRWMAPVASVAGIAVVVIGAFVIVPDMVGGGESASEDDTFAAMTEETTTMAAESAGGEDEGRMVAESDGLGAASTTAVASDAPLVPRVESYDLSKLRTGEEPATLDSDPDEFAAIDISQFEQCFDELEDQLPGTSDYVVRAVAEEDGRDLLLVTYLDEAGNPGGAAIDPASCELVATADS